MVELGTFVLYVLVELLSVELLLVELLSVELLSFELVSRHNTFDSFVYLIKITTVYPFLLNLCMISV